MWEAQNLEFRILIAWLELEYKRTASCPARKLLYPWKVASRYRGNRTQNPRQLCSRPPLWSFVRSTEVFIKWYPYLYTYQCFPQLPSSLCERMGCSSVLELLPSMCGPWGWSPESETKGRVGASKQNELFIKKIFIGCSLSVWYYSRCTALQILEKVGFPTSMGFTALSIKLWKAD